MQPTLVISQGSGLVETLRGSFGVTRPMDTNLDTNLARCDLDDNQFIWAALQHPTRNWSTINQPYFRKPSFPHFNRHASGRSSSRRRSKAIGVKNPLEESETLQEQAQNNSLAQFSASPDLQNEFVGAVIGAMASSEDLSTQILNNPELSSKLLGELVPIIYQGLKPTA